MKLKQPASRETPTGITIDLQMITSLIPFYKEVKWIQICESLSDLCLLKLQRFVYLI